MIIRSYELPEPVRLEPGKCYVAGITEDGAAFVREPRADDPEALKRFCAAREMEVRYLSREESTGWHEVGEQPWQPGLEP